MSHVKAIVWDVDKVWYGDISTNICAERSPLDPKPYMQRFVEGDGWFSYSDFGLWEDFHGGHPPSGDPVVKAGALAQMLTEFYYEWGKNPRTDETLNPDVVEERRAAGEDIPSLITRAQLIEGKQAVLSGMNIKLISEIAASTEYTPGLVEAVKAFREAGLYQAAFSDGFGPFVHWHTKNLGMGHAKVTPAYMDVNGDVVPFEPWMLYYGTILFTGRAGEFDKAEAAFMHMAEEGYGKGVLAAIDDSGSNVELLLLPIHQNGGVAVGFNPTEAHKPVFRRHGIPILDQDEPSLEPFMEIVRDPRLEVMGRYCV